MCRRLLLALGLVLACRTPPSAVPTSRAPERPTTAPAVDPLAARLALLDERIDRARERLGVPGAALVIVREGQPIHIRGYGERAAKLPVTPDTLFPIGSTTKAFTAMLVMIAVDAGKLSLDDSPRKCLPDFKLRDPEADAAITVRDLLTHSSGLMGTDLAWYTGALSSAQLVALLAEAEPTAKLRARFQYQNVMYVAAGLCAANALGGEYEQLLRARILAPIGMGAATLSVTRMQQRPDVAEGHHRRGDGTLATVPTRNIDAIAPAAGLNASATMLATWLRLMQSGGEVGGKQLLSRKLFEQLLAPQFPAGPGLDYGLGWLRSRWRDEWQLSHTGGIDGFSALVAMIPARGLGFALVTNVDHEDLHGVVTREVFGLLDAEAAPEPEPLADPEAWLGTYGMLGGFKVELARDGAGLALHVPAQPPYPLERERGLRFRLGSPAPAGFLAELREKDGTRELSLHQPFGDLLLPKLDRATLDAAARKEVPDDLRELMGNYRVEGQSMEIEVVALEGGVSLVVPGQPPAPLTRIAGDRFALAGLPEGFWLTVRRDAKRRAKGLVLVQPNAELELALVDATAPRIGLAKLLARRATAHGSAALAKHPRMRITSELTFVHQGLRGTSVVVRATGDRFAEDVRLVAFERELGRMRSGFDGERAWETISFAPPAPLEPYTERALALEAAFDPFGTDIRRFASATVVRNATEGGKPVVIARFTTDWGAVILDSYDAKTFLLQRRELELPIDAHGGTLRETRRYSDWRRIGGIAIPHRVETESVQGRVIATVSGVELDATLDDTAFAKPAD